MGEIMRGDKVVFDQSHADFLELPVNRGRIKEIGFWHGKKWWEADRGDMMKALIVYVEIENNTAVIGISPVRILEVNGQRKPPGWNDRYWGRRGGKPSYWR